MNRFVKDNKVMLAILSVALVAALVMLVLVILEHGSMFQAYQKTAELSEQIAGLIRQKPAPVAGNVAPIEQNTAMMKAKVEEFKSSFTLIKDKNIDVFVKALGVDKNEFLKTFREEWESDNSRHGLGGRDRFYQRFSMKYPKWAQAREAFRHSYQQYSVEPIDDTNVDAVLLDVLGISRNWDNKPEDAMSYMWRMRSQMVDVLTKKNDDFRLFGEAASFGFDYKNNPAVADITNIVKNWGVVSDICYRISKTRLEALTQFKIRNLKGEESGSFRFYHYTLGVQGSLQEIRAFYKELNSAVADGRVYIVRSMFIYVDYDSAQSVFTEREAEIERLRQELEEVKNSDGSKDDSKKHTDGQKSKTATEAETDWSKSPYHLRPGYGRVLFGGKAVFEAVFDVDYVVLTEPELN